MSTVSGTDDPSVEGLLTFASLAGKGLFVWDRDLQLVGRNAEVASILCLPAEQFPLGARYAEIKGILRSQVEKEGNFGFWPLKPVRSFDDARAMVASDGENIGRMGPEGSAEVQVQRMILQDRYLVTIITDMSVFSPAHQSATRQRLYLDTMLQNTTDGAMLVDNGDRIVACNRRMLELHDVDATLFRPGMPARDFVRLHGDLALMPREAERERAVEARVALITGRVDTGRTVRFDRRLANGTYLDITRTALPRGAGVITVRDATASTELERQRHMFRTAIENLNEGVTMIGRDGVFQYVNQKALDLFDIDPAKVREDMHVEQFARASGDIAHLPARAFEREVADRVAFATTHRPGTISVERRLHNGRTLQVSRTALEGGAAVTTYRDITRETERTRLLAEAKASAEEASSLKTDFLAKVSHELRTPMNGVLGMAALLERTDLDEKQLRYLQVLKRSGKHMLDLIEGLLTVATNESDGLTLMPEPVHLVDLCEQCVEMVRPRAAERGLALGLVTECDAQLAIMADPTRLTQIVVNLLQNAVKFTETGHVELRLATSRTADGKITASIQVKDTGIGIDEEKLDEIFMKFAQADRSQKQGREGVGLGLSISRALAERMGGTLTARSELGQGSTFMLDVPFDAATEPPSRMTA